MPEKNLNSIKDHHDIAGLAGLENSALAVNPGIDQPEAVNLEQMQKFISGKKQRLQPEELVSAICQGDRVVLGQSITLIESSRSQDQEIARKVVDLCLPFSGKSVRIGITGVPGAGKSTFIEAFGLYLLSLGKKVAVMAVDPSSSKSKGSLMGDKTRMEQLSARNEVFIRPSSTAGYLGGVNRATRETMILCEAAGYDVLLIETVGVGQSETMVHSMVDFFLLLEIAGAGDELQGMKKGIMEMADAIAITKADGDNILKAKIAKQDRQMALHYSSYSDPEWTVPVETCSSQTGEGISEIWQTVTKYLTIMHHNGRFEQKRAQQLHSWLITTIEQLLLDSFYKDNDVALNLPEIIKRVRTHRLSPIAGAEKLLDIFRKS